MQDRGPRISRARLTVWTYPGGSCASWLTINWPQEGAYVVPFHDRSSWLTEVGRLDDARHLLERAMQQHPEM